MKTPNFSVLLQRFFTERLIEQLDASPKTVAEYRDAFRLLIAFASERLKTTPSDLRFEELNAGFLTELLRHLELERNNSPRTRNNRLSALRSFFGDVALNEPALALHCQRVWPSQQSVMNGIPWNSSRKRRAPLWSPPQTLGHGLGGGTGRYYYSPYRPDCGTTNSLHYDARMWNWVPVHMFIATEKVGRRDAHH